MASSTSVLNPVSSYAIAEGVALQLALDTFIHTYRDMLSVQQLITRHFGYPIAAFAFSSKSPAILKQLYQHVEELVTVTPIAFPVMHETGRGLLHQLREDCSRLVSSSSVKSETALLEELAEKAWIEGNLALFAFKHGDGHGSIEGAAAPKRLPFLGHISKMIKTMERFAKCWPRLIKTFRLDENVLLFILRRRADIDALHGVGFVRTLLSKLYPTGSEDLQVYLINAYSERGFHTLSPPIETLIDEFAPW